MAKSNICNIAKRVTLLLFDSFISFQDLQTFQQKLKSYFYEHLTPLFFSNKVKLLICKQLTII